MSLHTFGLLMKLLDRFDVFEHPATNTAFLPLIFAIVWKFRWPVHFFEDHLANAAALFELNWERIGVIEFERNAAFKSRIDPSGVLDKKPDAADRAASFHKRDQIVGQFEIFLRGGENERMRREGDCVRIDFAIMNFTVKRDHAHHVVFDHEKMVTEFTVDGRGLDGLFVYGVANKFSACDHFTQCLVGENHRV